jgi:omega-hydroxy-beta-dihydromenaquinone-9 sulfotransferase
VAAHAEDVSELSPASGYAPLEEPLDNPSSEKLRLFLVNWVFTTLYGMTSGECVRLLRKHGFAVDPAYWPRAGFMAGMGVLNSALAQYENHVHGPAVARAEIKPPLFILGHWRSGTTRLHNLLATDRQFAYASMFEVLNPHTFLSTERFSKYLFIAPRTRMMDDVVLDARVPFEDEFATCGTLRSPFLRWVFPRSASEYDRYLTFRGVPEEEVAEWAAALVLFYKKLTWRYDLPLLLKSPPHTGRVKLLLTMFPDARFVHIHRNPYAVFRSTQRQTTVSLRTMGLQHLGGPDMDDHIIRTYKAMHEAFFEECGLIPSGRFCDIAFEDLEKDPLRQAEGVYERLGLAGFGDVQPSLKRYVDATARYQKNAYPELPSQLRGRLARAWQPSFDRWGYAT